MNLFKRKIKLLNGCILTEKIMKEVNKHSGKTRYFHDIEVTQGKIPVCSDQYIIDEKTAEKMFKEYQNDRN